MSFFKQLFPAFDEQPSQSEAPNRDQPLTEYAPADERGPQITLSRIRKALYDPDDEYDAYESEEDSHIVHVTNPPSFDVTADADTAEAILRATRDYLNAKTKTERDRVNWTPEFMFEKIVSHPKGSELPEFSTAEELRHRRSGSDLTIPVKNLGMTVDKNMMNGIRTGLGPRPSKREDLIKRLRLEPRICSGSEEKLPYAEETYAELLAVLRAWNVSVESQLDSTQEQKELFDALKARCQLIDEAEQKHLDKEVLELQCLRLHRALNAFRPELETFQDHDVFNGLVITVANQGIASPNLDDEVRDLVIETLFREYRSRIYLSEEHTARRNRLRVEIERAKLQEDTTEVKELTNQRKKLDKESCNQASEEVRTIIKSARRLLYEKVLGELQGLAEQQVSQKWAACSIAKVPVSALAQSCLDNEYAIDSMLHDWDWNIDSTLKPGSLSVSKMSRLGADNNRLVKKFVGLDVSKAERKAVLERRRNDARTPYMMMEVSNQSSQLRTMSHSVLERMDDLNYSLACVLDAASASYRAHDTLLARIDEDESCCMRPLIHTAKEGNEPRSEEKEPVQAGEA